MWITRVSILRPVAISMLFVAIAVLGYQSLKRMPVDLYPDISFPYVTVLTAYAGAGPEEVEDAVSKPIEDAVAGVNNVKNVISTSSEGFSVVSIEFYLGTDVDVAASDVRARVSAVRRQLPRDVDEPVIRKLEVSAIPVVSMGMSSPRSAGEVRRIADQIVKDRLSQLPGVAAVTVTGGDVREIQVSVDKGRLDAYGLSISYVNQILASENLNVPAGTVKETRREYSIRAVGQFKSVRDLENVWVPTASGPIRLVNIAAISDSFADRDVLARLNRNDSVAISIQKQSNANTVSVVDAVRKELESLTGKQYRERSAFERFMERRGPPKASTAAMLPDVEFTLAFDQSKFIKEALQEVRTSIILGAILAITVIFLFLHTIRGTFIVALAIPTSLIAAFVPIYFAGFTMNQMVLLAMSLAVGILVDDSIVVLENIYRHLSLGEPPREAAFNGRMEIGLAAVSITMVDVVVFVPIAFMGGIVGQFFKQFGITIACATLFSLFVCFTLTPMLASRWAKREDVFLRDEAAGDDSPQQGRTELGTLGRFYRWLDRNYRWLDERYRRQLAWALQHRLSVMLIGPMALLGALLPAMRGSGAFVISAMIAALGLIGLIFGRPGGRRAVVIAAAAVLVFGNAYKRGLGFEFMTPVDQGQFTMSVEMPAGTALRATDKVARQLEGVLFDRQQFPEVESVFTTVGGSSTGFVGGGAQGANYSELGVVLVDKSERRRSVFQVMDQLRRYAKTIPAATIKVAAQSLYGGHGDPLTIELTGADVRDLVRVAERVENAVKQVPGTADADISWRVGKPEMQARIDRVRASTYGLTLAEMASALRTSLAGSTDTKFREGGQEYDIRVRLREDDRRTLNDIGDMIVGTTPAGPVRLREVAALSPETGPTKIDRKNRQRMVEVTADLAPGYFLQNVRAQVDKALEDVSLDSVNMRWGGEVEMSQESFGYMFDALWVAVALVFILMAALFESLLSPFVIMFSLPMAAAGAILALIMTGRSISIVSMVGVIMLMGLVTKNAILLVDYTNTLRSRGKERDEAVLEAGPTRLRPILMTTLSIIFAVLPTALALGKGSEFRAPMAIVVIGGLVLSTLLTLMFIPVLYTLIDDVSRRLGFAGITQRTGQM